jgi:hypothetical protein
MNGDRAKIAVPAGGDGHATAAGGNGHGTHGNGNGEVHRE